MKHNKRLLRLLNGKNRGLNVIKVLSKYDKKLKDKTIMDVGCGQGSLTIEFSKKFKKVYSIDASDKEIKITKERITKQGLKNVEATTDNALNIKSTSDKFNFIHLSGVFEWLRAGNPKKTAKECQEQFLKNIKRNMKEGAILYSGTENKLFPYFWLRDPHNKKWPLMVLLSEGISDFINKLLFKKVYLAKIHSYWTFKKMYEKEFKEIEFHVPIPHYQYVYSFANINKPKEIIKQCEYVQNNYQLDFLQKITVSWIKICGRLRLIKLFAPGFLTVAKK